MGLKHIALSDLEKPEIDARSSVDEAKFEELIDSIKRNGIIEPVVVREIGDGRYEIIAGARRVLAAHAARLGKIPCIVSNLTDEQVDAVRLDENLVREDLNPVDTARYLERIMEKYNLTGEEIAVRIGRTRAYISQLMQLLHKDPVILEMVETDKIGYTVARELNRLPDEQARRRLAGYAARSGAKSTVVHEWVEKELVEINRAAGVFVPPPPVTYNDPGAPAMIVHPCRACGNVGDINAMNIFRLCPDCGHLLEMLIDGGSFKDEQPGNRGMVQETTSSGVTDEATGNVDS